MSALSFTVRGIPGAQGSKKHVGRGVMVESSKKVKPWRSDVKAAAEQATGQDWQPIDRAVAVGLAFYFPRPRSHYRTGRNAHLLRDNAPARPTSRALGDIDKLARSTLDALVAAGVIADDSLVADLTLTKHWGSAPGATITIGEAAA